MLCYPKSSVMIHLEIPRRSADSSREHYCRLTPPCVPHINWLSSPMWFSGTECLSLWYTYVKPSGYILRNTGHNSLGFDQSWNVLVNYLSFISYFIIRTKYLSVICKRINTHGFSILQGIFNMCYKIHFLKQVLFL